MKTSLLLLLAALAIIPAQADATTHTVWAPGVSESGGWVDYNKTRTNSEPGADSGMCWAAAASNVITWWQQQNSETLTSSGSTGAFTLPDKDPWEVFRTIFMNEGSLPVHALNWWINGNAGNPPVTLDKEQANLYPNWANGNFLSKVYDETAYPISIISSQGKDIYHYSKTIVEAIQNGYALTLCVREGADHAFSLWGVDYTINENDQYLITKIWVTDSNDTKTDGANLIVDYDVKIIDGALKFDYSGEYGYFSMEAIAGMRSEPLAIPEPATATLSLLALSALAARRRRK